ncbi:MAG: hypothetical protein ABIF71_12895 [Planctomycetota bacterium]
MKITSSERATLRDLARRVADIAADPVMAARRAAWTAHNALRSKYPMMLVFPEGAWQEILPELRLVCADEQVRTVERNLRRRIHGFAEFVMAYEKRLLAPFGLTGYGCCEDLSRKLDSVCTIPHIRRISIAPSADVARSAEALSGGYILSWKPQPSQLVGTFNSRMVRDYIRAAVRAAAAHGCVLEMILKDTHTCENRPERFDEWTRIARDVIREEAGEPPADPGKSGRSNPKS